MKDLTTIHNDQREQPKSILEYTHFEMAEINAYQNKNRGFEDDSDEDLESLFDNQQDY